MKLSTLRSIGHNIADSLASGIGLMIGIYTTDVFHEAQGESDGRVCVDFLAGTTDARDVSDALREAIRLYAQTLPEFCKKHGAQYDDIASLEAHFGVDRVYGRHFTVTGSTTSGKAFTDQYLGVPGKRHRSTRRLKGHFTSPPSAA